MKRKKIENEARNRLNNCMLKIKELGIIEYIEFRKTQPRKYMKVETIIKKFFGGNEDNLDLILVPGAFEIPFALEKALSSGKYDAICCVGQ